MDATVAAVFEADPAELRKRLMRLRLLIYETAAATEGVGPLVETLKWGQASYLTSASGSGTRYGSTGTGPADSRQSM